LKIVQRSYNKGSRVETNPQSQGARVVSYARVYLRFYGRDGCVNFRGGSFDWKLKVLILF
jgi:hypothetical protein